MFHEQAGLVIDAIAKNSAYGAFVSQIQIARPPQLKAGDLSLALFRMAKELAMTPPALAQEIADNTVFPDCVESVSVAGPYLNIFFKRPAFAQALLKAVQDKNYGTTDEGKGQKVLIEHTSINPNASPHIGRARNAIIGDSVSRLMRFLNYQVEVHYYVNDMGKQIAMLVLACRDKPDVVFHEILDIYVEANKRLEEDPAFEQEVFGLLKKFEEGDQTVRNDFRRIADICVAGQKGILNGINIDYDVFDYESDFLRNEELEEKLAVLEKSGTVFLDEDKRLVLDLQKLGFSREEGRYSVLKRGNGSTMYGYRDFAYHMYKLAIATGKENNIVVLGEDHKLYFEQLSLVLEAFGYTPPSAIHYSFIRLSEGKMSTRKGSVVLLEDFLEEAHQRVKEKIKTNTSDLSETELDELAHIIAVGAVRFGVIKVKPNSNIVFDWDQALSFEGDTGPYIQYSYVRAQSILRAAGAYVAPLDGLTCAISDEAWELLLSLSLFDDVLLRAKKTINPAMIAQYMIEIAQKFNKFYHSVHILSNEDQNVVALGLGLCQATGRVIENGMMLLGIQLPEKM